VPGKRTIAHTSAAPAVARYVVGNHQILVSRAEGRWGVIVDNVALTNWFLTQAEAWAAGVREADRLDRLA